MLGGKPVRSSEALRMSVALSASFAGSSLDFSSFSRTKLSMSVLGQRLFFTLGIDGRSGGMYDQCGFHSAPCSPQRFSKVVCSLVRRLPNFDGGIRSSSSWLVVSASSLLFLTF